MDELSALNTGPSEVCVSDNTSNSFSSLATLHTSLGPVRYHRLAALEEQGHCALSTLPYSIRILLEGVLRNEDGRFVTREHILRVAGYKASSLANAEIPFLPARVLLQDFTGVPALVDLAAMRSAVQRMGGDPQKVNPLIPVDLVIDHSVQVDHFGTAQALGLNSEIEFERNQERYLFLKWGQRAFDNFRVVPPASGIVHQVNLEYLASVVFTRRQDGHLLAYPDTLVGTDSHTTMINGLGVLGWGVGGIEAEAAMLGQPLYMLLPEVIGVRLERALPEGATATDLVLRITQMLRENGVVGKFVEFFGPGLDNISLPDRATVANMAPEYGATMGYFPIDEETLAYLQATGRSEQQVQLVRDYCQAQSLFRDTRVPDYTDTLVLNMESVKPALAGPKRPQDRIELDRMKSTWLEALTARAGPQGFGLSVAQARQTAAVQLEDGRQGKIGHGAVVIAAITSCTNTSNPSVMLAAGLLAKNAVERGLTAKPHVKTSLAPGSKVVTNYLDAAGLSRYLDCLGFQTVGYGCTTCIGNSGQLPDAVAQAVRKQKLVVASVLSGNRNFEGRVNPLTTANYLASPPLVVAYAIAGTVNIDLTYDPLGHDKDGKPVFLRDVWPTAAQIRQTLRSALNPEMFTTAYGNIMEGNAQWNVIPVSGESLYEWSADSTYIQEPPFFLDVSRRPEPVKPIKNARVLALLGHSVTTDHISPAGAVGPETPAGKFLLENDVQPGDFNSYGSRRGNDRVMTRGTFANPRLKNQMAPGTEGGFTTLLPDNKLTTIFGASLEYMKRGVPTIVIAGKDYGMGSSRDWAAKGALLLGVKAVLAESFERIHRSNLIGMGILPLEFKPGDNPSALGLTGGESFSIDLDDNLKTGQEIELVVTRDDGSASTASLVCRLDTAVEVEYFKNRGILRTVLRSMVP